MPLLSTTEACDVTDAFLYTLYGDQTFFRWKDLKDKMKFSLEKDLINWLLDIADHYEMQTSAATRSSTSGHAGRKKRKRRVSTAGDDGDSDDIKHETEGEAAAAGDGYNDDDGAGDDWEPGDEDGCGGEPADDGSGSMLPDPSTMDTAPNYTHTDIGVVPPPALLESSAESVGGAGGGVVHPQLGILRRFPCSRCPYVAKRKDHLKQHAYNMHRSWASGPTLKPHQCPKCKFRASRSDNLRQHMINKHGEPSRHRCDKCERPFGSRSLLESHVKRCKGPVKEPSGATRHYLCEQCTFSSSHQQSLRRHIHNVHENEELLSCPHCDFVATRRANFKQHLICRHRYESAHKCPHCNKPFSSRSKLDGHKYKCMAQPVLPPDYLTTNTETVTPADSAAPVDVETTQTYSGAGSSTWEVPPPAAAASYYVA